MTFINGDHCASLLVGVMRSKSCLKRSIPPCNLAPPEGKSSEFRFLLTGMKSYDCAARWWWPLCANVTETPPL